MNYCSKVNYSSKCNVFIENADEGSECSASDQTSDYTN